MKPAKRPTINPACPVHGDGRLMTHSTTQETSMKPIITTKAKREAGKTVGLWVDVIVNRRHYSHYVPMDGVLYAQGLSTHCATCRCQGLQTSQQDAEDEYPDNDPEGTAYPGYVPPQPLGQGYARPQLTAQEEARWQREYAGPPNAPEEG